jgi:ferrochelatase
MTASSPKAVLLVNLGSPDSPAVPDVRRYLGEFLMDGYVIDVPYLLRKLIVGGFILPFRPKRSAEAYRKIWWKQGSPLIVISQRVRDLLAERLDVPVELAMRYGNPSIPSAIERLQSNGVSECFVVPLYPHYAMSTVTSSVEAVKNAVRRLGANMRLKVVEPFYEEQHYIEVLAESARPYVEAGFDHLLVSYHGLPERHLRKTDPTGAHCLKVEDCCNTASPAHLSCYRHQVIRTTEAFTKRLGIPEDKYTLSFQSRLGKDAWLKPFTVAEARRLGAAGVKRLLVMCPAFVADCLETLEEIGMGVKEEFIEAGGKSFQLVPCLNETEGWIDVLEGYCIRGLGLSDGGDGVRAAQPSRESSESVHE